MEDTICAISTSLGVGAISIIRISGNNAIKIVNGIFKGKNLSKVKSHTIHYGYIVFNNEVIDEVLVSIMKSPKTFTMEDVVEINCHGGISTTNKILEILICNGCRMAEPGEFSKRAFLNGRIDLTKAEAISDLITVKTDEARKIAINQLQGKTTNMIKNLRKILIDIISNIEVNIDYPEYLDIREVTINDIKNEITNIKKQLEKIITEYEEGKIIKDGIKTVIVGSPNAGKSSILNALLDDNKAIVTDIPGTTRDIVEGNINLSGVILNVIDTAGIRKTEDKIEKIGIEKSIKSIIDADLVLIIIDSSKNLNDDSKEILEKTKNKTSIIVLNKNDLPSKIDPLIFEDRNWISINTINKDEINKLKNKIRELFNLEQITKSDYNLITNVRQISKIKESLNIIKKVSIDIKSSPMLDMIEIDLKEIWNILGEIIGDTYDEELLDNLFSKFCVGK